MTPPLAELPIDAYLGEIRSALVRRRAVVVVAEPGAGKTTRVPPVLSADGAAILLEPRRAAARSIARRIAAERGWVVGREIGWHVRFDRRAGPETRLLVATEGILSARLQLDPLLTGFRSIVLDEFHERSIHADLALALSKQAWRARDDLWLVVMSATLDAEPVAAFLDGCPVIRVPGRLHDLEIDYAPGRALEDVATEMLAETPGHVLCFLPGAADIGRAAGRLAPRVGPSVDVMPLHGSLDAELQDRALGTGEPGRRRIIVATNIAETSVTVPGVTAVVDTGLQKVARYDADRGIDSLDVERVTADAADQRAGRAGREASGIVRRLWDWRDRLRPHREPEIHRVDLSGTVLDVIAWGADPRQFEWFQRPDEAALARALTLLERLGAVKGTELTDLGTRLQKMPLHPRLACFLDAAGGSRTAVRACALLAERHFLPPRRMATSSDLLSAIDDWPSVPLHVARAASEIEGVARRAFESAGGDSSDTSFRRALLAGYPDRVAARRGPASRRLRLASGAGAELSPESGVVDGDFLVAVDVRARPGEPDAGVRIASRVEREWIRPTVVDVIHRIDGAGAVRAVRVERYEALVLSERSAEIDPAEARRLLTEAWFARGPLEPDTRLLRRLRFAGRHVDLEPLVRRAAHGLRALGDLRLSRGLSEDEIRALDREAPDTIAVPSGRQVRLEYADDGSVSASVKVQELFGLGETPRVGFRREPIVLALLAPNGRPVQVTRDLRSFWDRTYPEVRKELRGRYPKHPWPEDPWRAPPTARTKGRARS